MEKEEVAREELTWKTKDEEFSFMFCVFMMFCYVLNNCQTLG